MKKTILIFSLSRSPWIGGIYYRKNIINMLLSSELICRKYNIVVLVNDQYKSVFECFADKVKIITCEDNTNVTRAIMLAMKCCIKYRVKYVFPIMPYFFLRLFGITPVSWIADFQHCHHPEFFEEKEIMARNKNFSKMARACNPLVVSSEDALNDFRVYFSQNRDNVHVVHFTSYIDDEVKKLSTIHEEDVLKKYGLVSQGYAAVCNQFWKHKNHKVVLQAFKILKSQYPEIKLQLAMTGEPSDRRNPEYIQEIRELLEDPLLKDSVILLGFLNRTEQLCIMKHSKMIIQPSLFEGWGTVVEDAKVLNKKMILSDIKVHEEQKNEDCILFEKNNPQDLAEAIAKMYQDSSEITSRRDMTCDYANELEKIFV